MLAQCRSLAHLDHSYNGIVVDGAGRLAGVLAQCPALAHVCGNAIGESDADSAGHEHEFLNIQKRERKKTEQMMMISQKSALTDDSLDDGLMSGTFRW